MSLANSYKITKHTFFNAENPTAIIGLFLIFFTTVLCLGLLIQLIILPNIPSIHAGHGLLKGGDSLQFHELAVSVAANMVENGWTEWELRPNGWAPAGISAAAYYLTGVDEPWIILPINAFFYSVALIFLVLILRQQQTNLPSALFVAPMLFFPSAALIYSQIHKDVFSIAGVLALVFVWTSLSKTGNSKNIYKYLLLLIVAIVGCALIWSVRPYLLKPILLASTVAFFIVLLKQIEKIDLFAFLFSFVLLVTPVLFISIGDDDRVTLSVQDEDVTVESPQNFATRLARALGNQRQAYIDSFGYAGSVIDEHIKLQTPMEIIAYTPRALQVGLFAPFPNNWISEGYKPGSRIMRLVSGFEMAISYVLYIGVFFLLLRKNSKLITILIPIAMALSSIYILTLAFPNVGTLYRMRYGNWQLLICLGALGWGTAFQSILSKTKTLR